MKHWMIVVGVAALAAGCSSPPLNIGADRIVSQGSTCSVSYPQLPRCECGCAGDICTTGSMGVVVCDSDQARGPMIVPVRTTLTE